MLRRAVIATSLGLSRLLTAAPAAPLRTVILGRFVASQTAVPLIRRFGPVLELRRGYSWGAEDDGGSDDDEEEEEYDEGDLGTIMIDASDLSDSGKPLFEEGFEDAEFHSDEEI